MSNKKIFPVYELFGTPREIGRMHGMMAQKQIRLCINIYKEMFLEYSGITWEHATKYARSFIDAIEYYDHDIMEEIRGISEGSGFGLDDILALNIRSEIVMQGGQIDGCTSFVFDQDITADGCNWVGQNWDWKASTSDALCLFHIHQINKPDIFMITEAGIVAKQGFNDSGIGMAFNALGSDFTVSGRKTPLLVVLRGILNSRTISDAVENAGKTHVACCGNLTIGSSDGQGIALEIGPGDFDVLYGVKGYQCHTNHFLSSRWNSIHDTGKLNFPDTFQRYGRMQTMVDLCLKRNGAISFENMKEFMRDHRGCPDSICRHEDIYDTDDRKMCTVFSIIMNLNMKEMYICKGNPCEKEYIKYRLKKENV